MHLRCTVISLNNKMPKIILNSLKKSFSSILKNKSLFVLLFVLQIIFVVIFINLNIKYQTKILESSIAIADYLNKQQLDDISIATGILENKKFLGDDPLSISRNFNEIVKDFRLYLLYIFILFVFFISIIWSLTNKLVHELNSGQLIKNFLKILIVSFFYLGLIFAFFLSLFNIPFTELAAESMKLSTKYVPFFIFSIALIYFMFVSISLLHKTELKNIIQKTLFIGIKKVHYILSVYLINIFLLADSLILFFYFTERNLFILLLSILLVIFSLVFGRIFMVNVVEKLAES